MGKLNKSSDETDSDDANAAFQIPDDLMWLFGSTAGKAAMGRPGYFWKMPAGSWRNSGGR
jgi:hypothetical protein